MFELSNRFHTVTRPLPLNVIKATIADWQFGETLEFNWDVEGDTVVEGVVTRNGEFLYRITRAS